MKERSYKHTKPNPDVYQLVRSFRSEEHFILKFRR